MINSATPVAVLAIGAAMRRQKPGARQIWGVSTGFAGVLTIAAPSITGADARPLGIGLLTVAVLGYGLSNNLIVEPQQHFGAVPIVARALLIATILLAPFAAAGYDNSQLKPKALVAVDAPEELEPAQERIGSDELAVLDPDGLRVELFSKTFED